MYATFAATVALAAASPAATPLRAMDAAIADAADGATDARLLCTGGAAPGERGRCFGTFRFGGATYDLTKRSRIRRIDRRRVRATADAVRRGMSGDGPPRLTGEATITGRRPPEERSRHADLFIDRHGDTFGQTTSARTWIAFPTPFHWERAYDFDYMRLHGAAQHLFDVTGGAVCDVDVVLDARLVTEPPRERNGKLARWDPLADGDPDATPIESRSDDPAGTTWRLEGDTTVRSMPAPPGIGPPETDTLLVVGDVRWIAQRFGRLGPDGFAAHKATKAQDRACTRAATRTGNAVLLRAVTGVAAEPRPRPPKADPDFRPLDPDF